MNGSRLLEQSRKAACPSKVFSTQWSPSVVPLVFCTPICVLPISLTTPPCSLLLHFLLKCWLFPLLWPIEMHVYCLLSLCLSFPPAYTRTHTHTPPIAERHKTTKHLHFFFLTSSALTLAKVRNALSLKLPCFKKHTDAAKMRLYQAVSGQSRR